MYYVLIVLISVSDPNFYTYNSLFDTPSDFQ